MIHTIRTVAVGDQESKIDSPIILYRGDREVEVEFTINGSKFTFTNGGNVIKSTNAPRIGGIWVGMHLVFDANFIYQELHTTDGSTARRFYVEGAWQEWSIS